MSEGSRGIRPARPDDVPAMLAIYGPVVTATAISFETVVPGVAEFEARLAAVAEGHWLVHDDGDRIAGFAYASPFRARAAYGTTRETTVYLDPECHGRGIGRQLMEALIGRLAADGVHRAIAGIVLPNEASIALHERLGFVHVGTFGQVGRKFDRWHDLGFWQLDLPAAVADRGDGSAP